MPIPSETQKLMRLLAQVILADGHIYDSEIDALIQGVQDLGLTDETGDVLTEPQVRDWFSMYLQELNKTWTTESKDIVLTRLILSLAEWPNKQAVVDTLVKISLADEKFHMEEKTLISIVKAYWQYEGLEAPGATIIPRDHG